MTCTARIHDTLWAYSKYGCRCPAAREANRLDRERRRVRSQHIHRKGPASGYVDQVAVQRCLNEQFGRGERHELHTAIGRLEAEQLTTRVIASRLGITERTVTRYRARRRQEEATQC